MDKFKLQLDNKTIEELAGVDHLPNAPIKRLEIKRNVGAFDVKNCINIVKKYRATIETLKFADLKLSFYELKTVLTKMDNLRDLELQNVEMTSECVSQIKLPNLKSLTMDVYYDRDRYEEDDEYESEEYGDEGEPDEILNSLKYNCSIEKLEYSQTYDSVPPRTSKTSFTEFIKTTPNIKYLKLEGFRADELLYRLPLKLETLYTESLDISLGNELFLHLKELRLRNLPFDNNDNLETIFHDMNLESFYLAGVALIKNYEWVHVDKELTVFSGHGFGFALEILRHGKCKWKYGVL
jgi:hypothetical protein